MRFSKHYLIKKIPAYKLEKYIVRGLLTFLGALFVTSIIIGQVEQKNETTPLPEDILNYAYSFLPGGEKEAKGITLDCSGFTKAVFDSFKIILPPSSAGQYEISSHLDPDIIGTGDLLFFNTSGKGVSHVAISIDSVRFIHSPGVGRSVTIDSLGQTYWKTRIICGGKINLVL